MITELWNWLCTHPSIVNHYRGLRLLNGKNCIALLYEHNVAAVLANNLGIFGRLFSHTQSGCLCLVHLLLCSDCNILCFLLCGVIQIGLVSGTTILFGFTDHPIIEKSVGIKVIAGSWEAKGLKVKIKVKVEHIDLVE